MLCIPRSFRDWKRTTMIALCLLFMGQVSTAKAAERLVITGASTMAPLIAEMAKRFEQKNPGVRVDVQTGGSSRGINDVRQKMSQIGMVSRALKSEEKDLLAFPVANDGIGIIVHKNNPVKQLSNQQVVEIYKGHIKNWQAVGGPNAPITVINKAEGRSTLELFLQYFQLKNSEVKASVVIGDNQQGIKTVAGNPMSIGYVSIGSAESEIQSGAPLRLLPISGVSATTQNVASGVFPLARPLNLVAAAPPQGLSERFVQFARSPEVKDLVEQQFFVPLQP